nr:MAG TPA: hypothetical protein [Caudoviricetes sp.]
MASSLITQKETTSCVRMIFMSLKRSRRYCRRARGIPSRRHCATAEEEISQILPTDVVPPRPSITRDEVAGERRRGLSLVVVVIS